MKYFIPSSLIIILSFLPAGVQGQDASSQLQADTLGVGDEFIFTLLLRDWGEYDEVVYPDSAQFGSDYEILNRSVRDDGTIKSITYELQYFGAGNTFVPDTDIGLISGDDTTFVSAPGRSFVFEGLVTEEDDTFRPFKALFEFTALALWMWIAILAFFLIVGWLAYIYWKEKTKVIPPAEEPAAEPDWESPLDRLKMNIRHIREKHQSEIGYSDDMFLELSMAIRTYLSEVHDIPAPESTYSEIMEYLDHRMIPEDMQKSISRVLKVCDDVKFAGFKPQQQDIDEVFYAANSITDLADKYDRGLMHLMRIIEEEQDKVSSENQATKEQTT